MQQEGVAEKQKKLIRKPGLKPLQILLAYAIIFLFATNMERCPSGRRCLTRNQVWLIATVGSNPTLSAIDIIGLVSFHGAFLFL